MLGVVFKRAVEEYFSNIRVMLSFGVLFVFVVFFIFFSQFFFNSGSVFLSFNSANILDLVGIVLVLVFLYIFSFFISLTVYSVHRDVQSVSFDTYWGELFRNAALKIFFLYLVLAIIFYAISAFGFYYGFVFWGLVINLLIGLAVMFAPQSIVLDGAGVREGIGKSFEFWRSNFLTGLAIFVVATVLLFGVLCLELFLDFAGFSGIVFALIASVLVILVFIRKIAESKSKVFKVITFVILIDLLIGIIDFSFGFPNIPGIISSFFIVLVVLVPFIEQAKSYAYLMKSDLLKSNEFIHARAPRSMSRKPVLGTRLREKPRHGSKL